jgi:hypothetical protein
MGVHLTSHTSITSALHEVESLRAQSMALRPSSHNMVVIKHNKREMDLIARAWRFVGQRHILRCYARRTKREFCNPILEENDLLMRRCDQAGTVNRVAATCQTAYPITFC